MADAPRFGRLTLVRFGFPVRCVPEAQPLGTGGGMKNAGALRSHSVTTRLRSRFASWQARNAASTASFAGASDNKPIAIPVSLTGYNDAQRAYRRDEAKRASWYWRML